MAIIKKFNQMNENVSNDEITVKDIINYLEKFDPETKVILDRDGWDKGISKEDKIRRVIDDSPITHQDSNYLIINN